MPLLGELGVVERHLRRLEIGAAILLAGVEEERIEPAVEIVVMCDIAARARIELLQVPRQITHLETIAVPMRSHVNLSSLFPSRYCVVIKPDIRKTRNHMLDQCASIRSVIG